MGFLQTIIGGAIPGVSGIVGMLASDAAAKRQQRLMEEAINNLQRDSNTDLFNLQGNNARSLYGATGRLSDALQSTGRALNASLGEAGVFNSSATAGALTNQANQGAASLLELESRNRWGEQQLQADTRRDVARMRYNNAAQGYDQAMNERGMYQQGLIQLGGQLANSPTQDYLAQQDRKRLRDAIATQDRENPAGVSFPAEGVLPAPAANVVRTDAIPVSVQTSNPFQYGNFAVPDSNVGTESAAYSPYTPKLRAGSNLLRNTVPRNPLQSVLQTATQNNLRQTGANRMRTYQPPMNGTRNQSRALPGNRRRRS